MPTSEHKEFSIREAGFADTSAISELIELSARGLSRDDYSEEQIEAAIASVYGVDSELIQDRTYFVAESGGQVIGCGGWSRRKTRFGGDRAATRERGLLDPERDAARIRAFFVHPGWARRGVGQAILQRCEREAGAAGFRSIELVSTLPGLRFYSRFGYAKQEPVLYDAEGTMLEFVPMRKELA